MIRRPARRPRLLDLFCGAGGASVGYHAAGFDVTGVDSAPQPYYPFPFIQADALTVADELLAGFDVIHASPPCQLYSTATPASRRAAHPDLVEPIRNRLVGAVTSPGGPWAYVIENVPGAPLHAPVTLCGDSLRLGVRRHRLFESNLQLVGTPCWHDRTAPPIPVYGSYGQRIRRVTQPPSSPGEAGPPTQADTGAGTEAARAAMGIDWMPWPALTQAIPPAYTFWLAVQLHTHRPTALTGDASTAAASLDRETSPDRSRTSATLPGDGSDLVPSVTTDATPPAALRHCRCGTELPPRPSTGRWPRYCSAACRQAAYRARHGATTDPCTSPAMEATA